MTLLCVGFGVVQLVNGIGYVLGEGRSATVSIERAYPLGEGRMVEGYYSDDSGERRRITFDSGSIQPGSTVEVRFTVLPWGWPTVISAVWQVWFLLFSGLGSLGGAACIGCGAWTED